MPKTRPPLLTAILLGTGLLGATLPVAAEDDFVARCHELAASPADPGRIGPGVPIGEIDTEAAVAACREAVARHPGDGRLQLQLGRALDASEDFVAARQAYQAGSEAGSAVATNNLGVLYRDAQGGPEDLAQAAALFRQAGEAGLAVAQWNLGRMYDDGLGVEADPTEAERWFRLAIEGGDVGAMNSLAWMWVVRNENLDEASTLAEQAVAAAPDDAGYVDTLGWIRYRQGRFEDALAQARRVVELDPAFAPFHDRLGDIYAALGRPEEARAAWRQSLELTPPGEDEPTWDRAAVERKLAETP